MLACQLARRGGDPAPSLPPLQPRSCAIGAPECACTRGVRWCEQTVSAQRSWRGAADALPRQARRCARRVRLAQLRLPAAAPHGPAAAARKCDPDTRRGRTRAEGRGHPRRCALAPTRPARGHPPALPPPAHSATAHGLVWLPRTGCPAHAEPRTRERRTRGQEAGGQERGSRGPSHRRSARLGHALSARYHATHAPPVRHWPPALPASALYLTPTPSDSDRTDQWTFRDLEPTSPPRKNGPRTKL